MCKSPCDWQYLERRPGSSYRQLSIKGKRIWAWTLYCEFMNEKEPRTPEQLAADFDVPVEAVREAIEYCKADPSEIHQDRHRDAIRAKATGMDQPGYRAIGKPDPLSTEIRARLGL